MAPKLCRRVVLPLSLAMLMVLLCSGISMAAPITVRINGQTMSFSPPPRIVEGSTLVPLRGIFEALGANVSWKEATKTVVATKSGVTITLQVGNKNALKNTDKLVISVPPQIIEGRVFVPLRFVSESLGAFVVWDHEHYTVRINSRAENPPSGNPVAEGNYDPATGLSLNAKLNASIDVEVTLEPGALAQAASVKLYSDSAQSCRLITDADVVTQKIPGKSGLDAARIKVIFSEKWPFQYKRPIAIANGELLDNRCWIGEKVIRTGVRIIERDTAIKLVEASDAEWNKVEVLY